jgi:hypothetical protein
MTEVTELLQKVIKLIEKDVAAIENLGKYGDKLPHPVAADLVDYSRALLNLSSTLDAKEKENKSKYARMSTEQLIEEAKKIVEQKS